MTTCADLQLAIVTEHWSAPAAGGGGLCQRGEGVEAGDCPGGLADRCGHRPHLLTQATEELVFPLAGPGSQLKDAPFPLFQFRGDEALLISQGLAADPMVRHR